MPAPLAAREWISSNGSVFNVEVLIQVFSVTPYIALEKFNALHVKEYLNCIGYSLHVRNWDLNHLQTRGLSN